MCERVCVCAFSVSMYMWVMAAFHVKHVLAHRLLGLLFNIKGEAFFTFPLLPFKRREGGREREGEMKANGTRGGGIVFPLCVHYG